MNEIDILGIDLGTTNSAIAEWTPELGARVLPNAAGQRLTRSVVFYEPETGQPIVGAPAIDHLRDRPDAVVYSLKRFMGRTARDRAVEDDRRDVTYDVEETDRRRLVVHVGDQRLTPERISAEVLRQVAQQGAAALGRPVDRAIITVPAYFEEPQRQATKKAGELAGLEVPRLVSEPTAAALAFGLGSDRQTVAVFDLGGGTFDISVLRAGDGLLRVRATSGDTHLGGDDFDRAIVRWLAEQFERATGARPAGDPLTRTRLREAAREAKVALTTADEHAIRLPGLNTVEARAVDFEATLTKTAFEGLVRDLIDKALAICGDLLDRAQIPPGLVDQVLLVGGQTRTPAIKAALTERFGWQINDSVNPDEAVALGAAILGARMCGHLKESVALWDVTPLSLGVELDTGAFEPIIRANQQVPVEVWRRGDQAFTTSSDRPSRVIFNVFQGERPRASDNTYVGRVQLDLATVRGRGEHRIACLFRIDQDGILHVRAEESDADGTPVEVSFDRSYQLTAEEAEEQVRAAEEHSEEDAVLRRRYALDARLEKARRVAPADLGPALTDVERALAAGDLDEAERLLDALESS